jgi:hypothetical protein
MSHPEETASPRGARSGCASNGIEELTAVARMLHCRNATSVLYYNYKTLNENIVIGELFSSRVNLKSDPE